MENSRKHILDSPGFQEGHISLSSIASISRATMPDRIFNPHVAININNMEEGIYYK